MSLIKSVLPIAYFFLFVLFSAVHWDFAVITLLSTATLCWMIAYFRRVQKNRPSLSIVKK